MVEALISDPSTAAVADSDRAMIDYAVRLTLSPETVTQSDVTSLREVGFSDHSIHDICCVTSYYAFVNRVADGLGVDLEEPLDR